MPDVGKQPLHTPGGIAAFRKTFAVGGKVQLFVRKRRNYDDTCGAFARRFICSRNYCCCKFSLRNPNAEALGSYTS